jgi:phage terminase large subunit-like protein
MPLLENPQTNLSKEDEAELRLLCAEIEHRRIVNPLAFYNHLPTPSLQGDFHYDPATNKCLFGGNRGGKTEEAAEYAIRKGLDKPKQRIWVCSETFSDSVNIMQRKFWALFPKNQIIYGSYDDINGFTNRKLKSKNGTLWMFKSYDQGVQSFAQDDVDLIVNDEEPPYDIYKEQRMRLIDRNGEMIISMTSTKGVTD